MISRQTPFLVSVITTYPDRMPRDEMCRTLRSIVQQSVCPVGISLVRCRREPRRPILPSGKAIVGFHKKTMEWSDELITLLRDRTCRLVFASSSLSEKPAIVEGFRQLGKRSGLGTVVVVLPTGYRLADTQSLARLFEAFLDHPFVALWELRRTVQTASSLRQGDTVVPFAALTQVFYGFSCSPLDGDWDYLSWVERHIEEAEPPWKQMVSLDA